jgi:hypothetical protein
MIGYCPICDNFRVFYKDGDEARCDHCHVTQGLNGMVEGVQVMLGYIGSAMFEPLVVRVMRDQDATALADTLAHPDELAETLRKELLPVKEAAVQLNVPAIPVLIVLETPKREVTVSTALWVGQDGNVAPYTEGQFEKPIPPPLPPFNYHEYLRSPQWKEKRKAALARANYRCLMCNSPDNLDVHHRTYKNIGNEREEDLAVLCRTCHDIF